MDTTVVDPSAQVLALANVEFLEIAAAFENRFNAGTRDTNATTDRKIFQFKEVQADAAERAVGDRRTAECEVEVREHWAAQGENFRGRVGKGTTERLKAALAVIESRRALKDSPDQAL